MHEAVNNQVHISSFIGIFFWLVIVAGIIVFVRSAFKGPDKSG